MTIPIVERGPVSWASYRLRTGDAQAAVAARVPDFLVIAPPKTGTSWLFENLRRHPQVYMPPVKELRYFDSKWRRRDLAWYAAQFARAGNRVAGEASPPYALLPDFAIELVRELNPGLKLVFLMRDPVVRAWSQIKHCFRHFEGPFAGRSDVIDETDPDVLLAACVDDYVLASGDYKSMLKRWLKHFPANQLFITTVEDMFRNPAVALRRMFHFLGVHDVQLLEGFPLHERVNAASTDAQPPEAVSQLLAQLHAPRIEGLRSLMQQQFAIELPWRHAYAHRPVWITNTSEGDMVLLHDGGFCRVPVAWSELPDTVLAVRLEREIAAGRVKSVRYPGAIDTDRDAGEDVETRALTHMLAGLWHTDDAPLVACRCGYNIFRDGNRYVALPVSAGKPLAVRAQGSGLRARWGAEAQSAGTLEAIVARIDPSSPPTGAGAPAAPVLVASFDGWNFVRYGDAWYAVAQSLGPVDLTQDLRKLREQHEGTRLFVGASEREVRDDVRAAVLLDNARRIEGRIATLVAQTRDAGSLREVRAELDQLMRAARVARKELTSTAAALMNHSGRTASRSPA